MTVLHAALRQLRNMAYSELTSIMERGLFSLPLRALCDS